MKLLRDRYTSREIMDLTGVSARQLDYWDVTNVIAPSIQRPDPTKRGKKYRRRGESPRGRQRIYSAKDLIEFEILFDLRRNGMSMQRIRRVLEELRKERQLRLLDALDDQHLTLLTDGDKNFYFCYNDDEVINVLKDNRQTMFRICLDEKVKEVREKILEIRSKDKEEAAVPAVEDVAQDITEKTTAGRQS
mgnify:CR=1 FL=1